MPLEDKNSVVNIFLYQSSTIIHPNFVKNKKLMCISVQRAKQPNSLCPWRFVVRNKLSKFDFEFPCVQYDFVE